ncbi:helicase [bacterium]|nr:helicase [bacterium]
MSDLTFITNEGNNNLKERFKVLLDSTRFFDVLVGYFYLSGFYLLYPPLEKTEKIRILIGIGTDGGTIDLIDTESNKILSSKEIKQIISEQIQNEMLNSKDSYDIELGIRKFLEWIKNGKLIIKAFPEKNIHSKLYIFSFKEGDRDKGRVITGSSNFTKAGLMQNLEFNIELKNVSDYNFAKEKYEELWKNSIDVTAEFFNTSKNKTWLNDTITPYEIYLKFLYEYFKNDINADDEIGGMDYPKDIMKLAYQEQAVINANKILNKYGGVFLSDVVGLGKTYMAAMLAKHIGGKNLVIASPILLDENNPGSWTNVFYKFNLPLRAVSIGKLDNILSQKFEYDNVFIDEAHRFRNDVTHSYETLSKICRGRKIILVTATPLNNYPKDILSQIKLFQKGRNSTIPNIRNLEGFFNNLEQKLKKSNRKTDFDNYIKIIKQNSKEIRNKVLKYLMVRRTRSEVENYYSEDLKKQKFRFPNVNDPTSVYYEFNKMLDDLFTETIISLIDPKTMKYTRYTPLLYQKGKISPFEEMSQKNMGGFMKILLVKRLTSSFFAFKKTIDRFIESYKKFIYLYEKEHKVYISKKYLNRILDFYSNGDYDSIQKLIDEGRAEKYSSDEFKPEFIKYLKTDLKTLENIAKNWKDVNYDPKVDKLIKIMKKDPILKGKKVIIFTESKETAEYLAEKLEKGLNEVPLLFHGSSNPNIRKQVINNFDANAINKENKYRILVSTEVLSQGVNLHRSNIVINYDIPWNPTKMIQRVGRVNRIDTEFSNIYIYNFFPTEQANDEIRLKEIAIEKIERFIELLGNDSKLLTDGEEIKSHELFDKLSSKSFISGEEEGISELKYLKVIRDIRDKDKALFEKIKKLPKKSRTSVQMELENQKNNDLLFTYFEKGNLHKFFIADNNKSKEIDFFESVLLLEKYSKKKREKMPSEYYLLLEKNKKAITEALREPPEDKVKRGGGNIRKVLTILCAREVREYQGFTEDDEEFIKRVIRLIEDGAVPKNTIKNIKKAIENQDDPLKIFHILKKYVDNQLLNEYFSTDNIFSSSKKEVILSEYLIKPQISNNLLQKFPILIFLGLLC